jgi:hypothetical protein
MNEQQLTIEVRRLLDESAERLPYRVSQRLAASREAALARLSPVREARLSVASATRGIDFDEPGPLWRLAGALIPILIVIAGLVSIAFWDDSEKAQELADVDAAVLTDDVPISAYTDRGFGVFLKNNRQ